MRFSELFAPTLKEEPAEAEVVSHKLMLRAGMLRKVASGIYSYLPLGFMVLNKVSRIVQEEMDRAGAQEILMPALQPAEVWQKSGRWYEYGPEMMRLKDRSDREFCLGPTHEELITALVMNEVRSYRQLPLIFYQIQVKFRDEVRPRFGLMRGREFIMKDAYSFDADQAGLEESYRKIYEAYGRVIERCGLSYRAVEADPGIMGGRKSQEFMVLAQSGEEAIAFCTRCDYAANREAAKRRPVAVTEEKKELTKVYTPGYSSIKEVSDFLEVSPQGLVKTLIYQKEDGLVAVLLRGDREVNDLKLSRFLGTAEYRLLPEEDFAKYPGLIAGFVGPVGLNNVLMVGDEEVRGMMNFVIGANEKDYHYISANVDRDFKVARWGDFTFVEQGDACPQCGGLLEITRGIEVGHVFQLGTKYSESLEARFLDKEGSLRPFVMGSYGIGVSRLVAAAIEQHHDEKGIKWPMPLAPYEAVVLVLRWEDENLRKLGEDIYAELTKRGIETLLDDRQETAGVKFADADLIGIPLQVIVGKKMVDKGRVEIGLRADGTKLGTPIADVVEKVEQLVKEKRSSFEL